MTELVTTANMLIDQVHTTNEATLDSRFLSAAAEIGAEKIQKLPFGMHSFGLTDWLDLVKGNLSRFHQHQQLKTTSSQQEGVHYPAQEKCREAWESIGNRAMVYWKGVMTTDFLCGPIAVVPKEKQARSSTRRTGSDSRAPTKEALAMTKEAFEAQAAANNNATSNNVMLVAEALSAYESVPLYRFVTHPASFSRSVENLFYVSFLISDGRAALSLEKDGEILIRPLEEGDGQEDGEDEGTTMRVMPKNQRVFNFSMFQWRQAIKIYRISKPLIDF